MFVRKNLLLDAAPAEGGDNKPDVTPAPAPSPAPPEATRIVVTGEKSERELTLEKQLEEANSARRKAETDASYHQDEARRLKELQTAPPPTKKKVKRAGVGWFEYETEEN